MKQILKLVPVVASFALITSCSDSSSSGSEAETPLTLDGKFLGGGMYVDYQEGDGFELEAKDFTFSGGVVTFGAVEYDQNDNERTRTVTGNYVFEKTGEGAGKLEIAASLSFKLNLVFNGDNVIAEGTMNEGFGKDFPAKGSFNMR